MTSALIVKLFTKNSLPKNKIHLAERINKYVNAVKGYPFLVTTCISKALEMAYPRLRDLITSLEIDELGSWRNKNETENEYFQCSCFLDNTYTITQGYDRMH